jgi:hypothetical protein
MSWKVQVWNGVRTNLYQGCKNSGGTHLPLIAGWTRSYLILYWLPRPINQVIG